jgi:hypothetical protein
VRLGGFFPDGGGDLWNGNEALFTLDASDFDGFNFGTSLLHSVNPHAEIGVNADFYDEGVASSYRDPIPGFPDLIPEHPDGFPIVHDTELSLLPVTLDVRYLPWPRSRGPRRGGPVIYFGAGLGMVFWEYEEVGEFLDFSSDPVTIIADSFRDSGTAFTYHVLAGIELPLSLSTNVLFEGKWSSADDELQGDFSGLGEIELGGASVCAGLSFRF